MPDALKLAQLRAAGEKLSPGAYALPPQERAALAEQIHLPEPLQLCGEIDQRGAAKGTAATPSRSPQVASILYRGDMWMPTLLGNCREGGARVISALTHYNLQMTGEDWFVTSVRHGQRMLIVDGSPQHCNNWLAAVRMAEPHERANVSVDHNGDFRFVGRQLWPALLLARPLGSAPQLWSGPHDAPSLGSCSPITYPFGPLSSTIPTQGSSESSTGMAYPLHPVTAPLQDKVYVAERGQAQRGLLPAHAQALAAGGFDVQPAAAAAAAGLRMPAVKLEEAAAGMPAAVDSVLVIRSGHPSISSGDRKFGSDQQQEPTVKREVDCDEGRERQAAHDLVIIKSGLNQ